MRMCVNAGMHLGWAVLALLALHAASELSPRQEAESHRAPGEWHRALAKSHRAPDGWHRAHHLPLRPHVQVYEPKTHDRRHVQPWPKRTATHIHSRLMLRSSRSSRPYDVPQIVNKDGRQCPSATDGMERFSCPTLDRQGRYRCIDDHVLCDGFIDCPNGEDEDRNNCMFFKTTKAHLDVLADALLRWVRGR